jgi:hypothetical protein
MTIWYILCSLGTFSGFGIMNQVKSGNPGSFPTEFIVKQYTEAVIKFFIANVVEGNCVKVESERLRKTIFLLLRSCFVHERPSRVFSSFLWRIAFYCICDTIKV